jgi:hypothetical protein
MPSSFYSIGDSPVGIHLAAETKDGCFLNKKFYNPVQVINQAAKIHILGY